LSKSITFQRDDLQTGLEADNCYYVAHEPEARGKKQLDLTTDPPPDLAIEIDLSSSSFDKLDLYAEFAVPEVWRYDGELLEIYHLGPDRRYVLSSTSRCFPDLPLDKVAEVLRQVSSVPETKLVRSFRDWVRSRHKSG